MSTEPYDIGDEDTEPSPPTPEEVEALTPNGAFERLEEAELANVEATRALERTRKEKKRATALALAVLEHYELDSAKSRASKVTYYTEQFRDFQIKNEQQFREWEAEQDEDYFETKTKLVEQRFKDEMRRRDDDREPLPPGVVKVSFPKLKRKAAAKPKGKQ